MSNSESVLVSVIMPVYNVEKYIEKAVGTITSQNFESYEIILVDDGSKDSSGKICDALAQNDSRIISLHKSNGGCSSARNMALEVARGKYIYFMDPDDYCYGNLLSENIELAEKYSCSQVVFGFVNALCDDKTGEEISRKTYLHSMNGYYTFEDFKKIFKCHLENVNHVVWNRIYTRESISDTRFPEELNTAEDAVFNLELIKKGFDGIFYNNKSYYVYLCRQNSLMNKYNEKRFQNEMRITDMIKELVESWGVKEEYEKYIYLKYAETVLSEYGNSLMNDLKISAKETALRIKGYAQDKRVADALKSLATSDFKGIGLKGLFFLTQKRKYRLALYFKITVTKLSITYKKIMKRGL